CALATSVSMSMPCSMLPPWIRSGGTPPSPVSMRAPMRASGTVTRRIGRFESEASPTRVVSKDWPASRPASRRMPVPALPQSSGPSGARRPSRPTPCTMRLPGCGVSMDTPMRRKIVSVARASSPSRKPSMREVPSASEASMIARCETDLSPGTASSPCSGAPFEAIQSMSVPLLIAYPPAGDSSLYACVPSPSRRRRGVPPPGYRRDPAGCSGHRDRIRAEHAHVPGEIVDLGERILQRRLVHVSLHVDEEGVLPDRAMRGPRFDPVHADAGACEWFQDPVERTGLVADRDHQRGAVVARRREQCASDHQEARGVVAAVLDRPGHHLHAVDVGGVLAGDRRRVV